MLRAHSLVRVHKVNPIDGHHYFEESRRVRTPNKSKVCGPCPLRGGRSALTFVRRSKRGRKRAKKEGGPTGLVERLLNYHGDWWGSIDLKRNALRLPACWAGSIPRSCLTQFNSLSGRCSGMRASRVRSSMFLRFREE